MRKIDLVYPQLCYKIVGILYDVFNNIGPGHKEEVYQKALCKAFEHENIKFQEQLYCPIKYHNATIGKYYLDFLIEDRIVLEIKKDTIFRHQNLKQVYSYLKIKKLKLGILANFTREGVRFKRIVNLK